MQLETELIVKIKTISTNIYSAIGMEEYYINVDQIQT